MPRLVACMICCKIERIPDPPDDVPRIPGKVTTRDHGVERSYTYEHEDGTPVMVPEYDPLLEDVVGRHSHGQIDTDVLEKNLIQVFPVDQATYERMDVVTELKRSLTDQTNKIFEEATYYKDEALACYNRHSNPELPGKPCIDFCSDSKMIGPKVRKKKHQTYLCHMCPYMQTYVAQEMRHKAGLYDPRIGRG